MAVALYLMVVVVLIFIASIINGFVLATLWGWFIVPVFGLAPLSLPVAIGISLIISYTTLHDDVKEDRRSTDPAKSCGALFGNAVFVLVIGWVVHLFV